MCNFFEENTIPYLKTKCSVLPDNGTHIPKHAGEAYLIFVVMRTVQLFGSYNKFCKKKVKVTLVQALRVCTGRTANRGSRGIALLFHDHGTRRG